MLGGWLSRRVYWSERCELIREVTHVQIISDVRLEGRGHFLSQDVRPINVLYTGNKTLLEPFSL